MNTYNFNDVDKYLREGGDPEAIAKAFADSLNAAIESNSKTKILSEKATKICDAWRDYVTTYFSSEDLPYSSVESDFLVEPKDIKALMDTLVELMPVFKPSLTMKKTNNDNKKNSEVITTKKLPHGGTFEDVVGSFLHDLGL